VKENARDYLKEFAKSKDDWLKALIYDAIETNGSISEERLNEIFNNLAYSKNITVTKPSATENDSDTEIVLVELNHKRGVNALKSEQKVKFSKNVTILYGMNGAGKSSYFKILNEIVGGNQKKEILPNIYSNIQQSIDVELIYEKKGKSKQTLIWNGNKPAIEPLNRCKVFDTSYLNGLLQTRSPDETLIQPLGLNLFSYIVEKIDFFKEKLNQEADKKRLEKPILNFEFFRNEIRIAFENHNIPAELKKEIENLYNFSSENKTILERKEKYLAELKQFNIQDKIKLESNKGENLDTVKKHIEETNEKLKSFKKDVEQLITEYAQRKQASNEAKERFEVLKDILEIDSTEWKEFIKAGVKYSEKIQDSDSVCPYCRQPLNDENSIKLIKAYAEFLKAASEQKLNETVFKIKSKLREIEISNVNIKIDNEVENILREVKCDNESINLYDKIKNIVKKFEETKNLIVDILRERMLMTKVNIPNTDQIIKQISQIIEKINSKIKELSAEDDKKQDKIRELEEEIKKLKENQSISEQEDKIRQWFDIDRVETELRTKANGMNTKSISDLSKKAYNELLTEKLKHNFEYELKEIGCKNLEVKLEPAGSKKGISHTKLIITKDKDLKSILSEGEQKAVGLALFIAECKLQKTNNPIILDDPINSLDHRIAGNFAHRLLKLDNQIIIFTHHRLFLDAFETSKENHICKTVDSDCNNTRGKHIKIYLVSSKGKNAKGVLSNYKANKARNHLDEIKKLVDDSLFDNTQVSALIRKTVECIIDEVIFNNQVPTKYSNKNSRINWQELKKINGNSEIVDKLEQIHSRVSGGGLHNGLEQEENPIEEEEFKEMVTALESILKSKK
jgi:energy-coupling factor transporter ATP-binding protein EcfA2